MVFMADVELPSETCGGKRLKKILEVTDDEKYRYENTVANNK